MQTVLEPPLAAHRRPAPLELVAAGLLAATVVLHVAAMVPAYFAGSGNNSSLVSQPDQAALYSVLAASWALALAIGLTGPHRTPMAAALAAGVAATELGFRVADLGDALRYGTSLVGAGLWVMEAAWVVGAAGAVVALVAVRSRHGLARRASSPSESPASADGPHSSPDWQIDWAAPPATLDEREAADSRSEVAANPYAEPLAGRASAADTLTAEVDQGGSAEESSPDGPAPVGGDPTAAMPSASGSFDATTTLPSGDAARMGEPASVPPSEGSDVGAESLQSDGAAERPSAPRSAAAGPGATGDSHERAAWTMLVAVLALLVAGAFLPAWDHAVAYSPVTGQGLNRSLGNAFSGPWQQVIGTVLAAVAMAAVPVVAIRLRNRAAGAAAVCGSLLVLGSQLTAAVIQVDQPVSPAQVGLSGGEAARLGLQLALKLTGWFTVDALAAYALFAAVLVWATLRVHHENSTGSRPSAPDFRSDSIPWAS